VFGCLPYKLLVYSLLPYTAYLFETPPKNKWTHPSPRMAKEMAEQAKDRLADGSEFDV
jgi:hypothetical protein